MPSTPAQPSPRTTIHSDELDLPALIQLFWNQKHLLLAYIAVFLGLAGLYLFVLATPRYAASVYVDAPFSGHLAQLNQGRRPAGLDLYAPEQVFAYFTRRLGSDEAFQHYLQIAKSYPAGRSLPASERIDNNWRVSIDPPQPKGRNLYKITVRDHTSQAAYDGLIRYMNIVRAQAADTLIDDAKQSVSLSMRNIERTLSEQRSVALDKRQDRIQRLSEALVVAKAIGQQQPQLTVAQPPSQDSLRPYLDGSELYARGIQALEAELTVLKVRQNDDPFISNLREEQARLRLLQELDIQLDNVHLFRFDGEIMLPERPTHPSKKMVVILAIMLASMLGVLHILWQRLWRSRNAS